MPLVPINDNQLELLVRFMEKNVTLAKSTLNNSQIDETSSENLWREITQILNEAGPLTKSVDDWKKLWTDLTNNVRNKVQANRTFIENQTAERRRNERKRIATQRIRNAIMKRTVDSQIGIVRILKDIRNIKKESLKFEKEKWKIKQQFMVNQARMKAEELEIMRMELDLKKREINARILNQSNSNIAPVPNNQ